MRQRKKEHKENQLNAGQAANTQQNGDLEADVSAFT